ncbi:MAG: mechanosensitive ion channel family protein [Betaproteobacteria bacterium]|nr:mechanosensitive ion channel family protein [Betaproteobacteria bacterium]
MGDQLQALDQVKSTAIDLAMKLGPKVVVAIVILIAGYFAGRWAGRATLRLVARFQFEPPVRQLLERIVRIFVLGLFAIMALQNLGVELLPLIAGLGVAGAGLALATQGVLSNVVAGLTIIFTRLFRVGDYVSIVKEEGEVLDISLFNATLGHPDRSRVVIPNRRIVGEVLHNFGKIRQLAIEVSLAADADLPAAQAATAEVLQANARVLEDPAPVVFVNRLAEGRIAIFVGPSVNVPDYGVATSEVNQAILEAFRARGVATAVPQREVRMLAARA